MANENIMILKTKYGEVEIELYADKAPNRVKDLKIWLIVENTMVLFFIE